MLYHSEVSILNVQYKLQYVSLIQSDWIQTKIYTTIYKLQIDSIFNINHSIYHILGFIYIYIGSKKKSSVCVRYACPSTFVHLPATCLLSSESHYRLPSSHLSSVYSLSFVCFEFAIVACQLQAPHLYSSTLTLLSSFVVQLDSKSVVCHLLSNVIGSGLL